MNSQLIRRCAALSSKNFVIARSVVTKTPVAASAPKAAHDSHGHDAHGHDDHDHPHPMFELPFSKFTSTYAVWGILVVGFSAVCGISYMQNVKHGFVGKK